MLGAEPPNEDWERRGLSQGSEDQPDAQKCPYPGKAAADQGDPRIVGHVEHQVAARFSQHRDQGEGYQQIWDQREQDMKPPLASTARAALRIPAPAA